MGWQRPPSIRIRIFKLDSHLQMHVAIDVAIIAAEHQQIIDSVKRGNGSLTRKLAARS